MSDPVLQLSTDANWQLAYQETKHVVTVPTGRGYLPIPPFLVPVLFTSPNLLISAASQRSRPSWYLGFRVKQLVDCGTEEGIVHEAAIPLNRGGYLIRFPPFAPQYRLRIEIPFWHESMLISIFEYVGPESNTTEDLIVDQTDAIRVDLARIETKIDGL